VIVPPIGYLERLREICTRHDILLVFDEVITGFGRLGKTFAADAFGVVPDIITFAKALTNGVIPMGGVLVRNEIYRAFMEAQAPEQAIEFCHGYTYSGHPIAAAAAHAVLSIFEDEGMFERAATLAPLLADAVHGLRGAPHVEDIRNIGLAAAIDLAPRPGEPGKRGLHAFEKGIEAGLLLRVTGDTIALAPPFIATADEIASMVARLHGVLRDGSL
jgi:beta-alanine--pyruvate transaminase